MQVVCSFPSYAPGMMKLVKKLLNVMMKELPLLIKKLMMMELLMNDLTCVPMTREL